MCLNCGLISCGRNDNKHALKHSNETTNHNLCINTINLSVFWSVFCVQPPVESTERASKIFHIGRLIISVTHATTMWSTMRRWIPYDKSWKTTRTSFRRRHQTWKRYIRSSRPHRSNRKRLVRRRATPAWKSRCPGAICDPANAPSPATRARTPPRVQRRSSTTKRRSVCETWATPASWTVFCNPCTIFKSSVGSSVHCPRWTQSRSDPTIPEASKRTWTKSFWSKKFAR